MTLDEAARKIADIRSLWSEHVRDCNGQIADLRETVMQNKADYSALTESVGELRERVDGLDRTVGKQARIIDQTAAQTRRHIVEAEDLVKRTAALENRMDAMDKHFHHIAAAGMDAASEQVRKMAEKHVDFILTAMRPLMIAEFVHGHKHGVEEEA